jgi:hypothetical protein
MNRPVQVCTLIGSKGLDFSVKCLNSFIRNAAFPFDLNIFTDGTLDIVPLQGGSIYLKNVNYRYLQDRENQINLLLEGYPGLTSFRKENILAYKLLDIPLMSDGPFLYIDSDVYFTKPFTFDITSKENICMCDSLNGYSIKPWHVRPFGQLYPYQKINTGFMWLQKTFVDLSLLEQLVQQVFKNEKLMKHPWAEQTLFAMFLSLQDNRMAYFDKRQIAMPFEVHQDDKPVAVHYVSSYRNLFQVVFPITNNKIEALDIFYNKRRLNSFTFFAELMGRKIEHYTVNRWRQK